MKTKITQLLSLLIIINLHAIAQGQWIHKSNFPGAARGRSISFGIGNYGYYGCGNQTGGSPETTDMWQYDPANDTWTQIADYPIGTQAPEAFVLNGEGYVGSGWGGGYSSASWYKYVPSSNTWIAIAPLPVNTVHDAGMFQVNGKGYVVGGAYPYSTNNNNTLYEYDPGTNTWSQKANFPYYRRVPAAFSGGGNGFAGLGQAAGTNANAYDLYMYDVSADAWIQKANFPNATSFTGDSRRSCFELNGMAYFALGGEFFNYNYQTDAWFQLPNPPFTQSIDGCFVINGKAYVVLGNTQEVWEYDPNGVPVTSSVCDTAYFGISNTNNFGQCTMATDGNIIAVGDADYVYGWTQGDIVLKKYTTDLQLIWSRTFYAGGGMDHASGVFTTSDGGYLIHTAFGNSNAAGMFSAGYIIKTDSSGIQEWAQTLTGQSYGDNYMSKCTENSQGEFMCFGHVQNHAGCSGYATRITKLSSSGAILWSYCIQQNADWNGGFDKMALSDNYLSAWNDLNSGNLVIQKWDDSGNQIGTFNYKFMNQFSTTGGVKRHPSGGFFLYGQYDSTGGSKNAFIAKFDENSVFQWETSFHSGQENSFNNLTLDVNGNILCTGVINETSQPGNLPLVKFSDSGSFIASAIFGDSSKNEAALGIVAIANGEVICSGWSESLGLLVKFCGFDSASTGIGEYADDALQLDVFPNPVNDQLNLSFESTAHSAFSITLFNLIGEKVKEEKSGIVNMGKNLHSISMDKLPIGIYVLRIQIGSRTISKKIVKTL